MSIRTIHIMLAALLAASCLQALGQGSTQENCAIAQKMQDARKYSQQMMYTKSIDTYLEAVEMCKKSGADSLAGDCYNAIADNYQEIKDYSSASEYYNMALSIFVDHKRNEKITEIYRKLGLQCVNFHLYETAGFHFADAMMLDSMSRNMRLLGLDLYHAACSDYCQYLDIDSLPILKRGIAKMRAALQYTQQSDSLRRTEMECCEQLMMMYLCCFASGRCAHKGACADSARHFFDIAESLRDRLDPSGERVLLEIAKANFMSAEGKPAKAALELESIEKQVEQENASLSKYKAFLYRSMIWALKQAGKYREAVEYSEKFRDLEESTYNREFAVKSTKAAAVAKYASQIQRRQKKEQEEIEAQELQTAEQRWITAFFAACIVLAGFLAYIVWKSLMRKRKNNYLLARQKVEISQKNEQLRIQNQKILSQRDEIISQRDAIEQQRSQLQEANSRITASIRYAQRIQAAAVPSREIMEKIFGECLVYWKPLNIVSGDFFWAFQSGKYKMIAVADCTGHGVPGAFMSMLGISTLNDIAAQKDLNANEITASGILDELREKIIAALRQQAPQHGSQEGIDMAFCIIDSETMKLQFSGANRPLWIIRKGCLIEYKGDKMPVGYHIWGNAPFSNTACMLEKGDTVYLASDGISNQFGGNGGKRKFTAKRLKELLLEIHAKPFGEQIGRIEQAISQWMDGGGGEQAPMIDDQILVGIRI